MCPLCWIVFKRPEEYWGTMVLVYYSKDSVIELKSRHWYQNIIKIKIRQCVDRQSPGDRVTQFSEHHVLYIEYTSDIEPCQISYCIYVLNQLLTHIDKKYFSSW